jgi:hypothetical protein
MRLLDRLRIDTGWANVEELPVECHRVGGPDGLQNLEELVGALTAMLRISTRRVELIGGPAQT